MQWNVPDVSTYQFGPSKKGRRSGYAARQFVRLAEKILNSSSYFLFFLTATAIVYDNHLLKVEQLQPLPQLGDTKQQSSNQTSHRTGSYMSTISLYVFPLMPAARSASKTHGCEVWIMGERRDPIPGRFVELAEEIIAFIWNGHSAFIWVNGAEGEIFSRRLTLCQHVEKGWLPENKKTAVRPNPSESAGERSLMVW